MRSYELRITNLRYEITNIVPCNELTVRRPGLGKVQNCQDHDQDRDLSNSLTNTGRLLVLRYVTVSKYQYTYLFIPFSV